MADKGRFNPLDPLDLFQKPVGNPLPASWNGHLLELKSQARDKLIAAGYRPEVVDKALTWFEKWLIGMARRMAPNNDALQKTVVQSYYAQIAPQAEKWLRGIEAAFAPGP